MRTMDDERLSDPEDWVDQHGDCLYRYALRRLGAPELAADLVQDTFLEAFRARESFAGRASERTWLVGILRHKIIDHFRKSKRERTATNGVAADAVLDPAFDRSGHWRVAPAAWRGDPSRQLESKEFWEVLSRCLGKLPEGLANAFFFRELDGLAADQVQQLLGITPANLWARLHRARSLLRQCLELGWFGGSALARANRVKGRSRS